MASSHEATQAIQEASSLLSSFIPEGSILNIIETNQLYCSRYLVTVTYVSKKSGYKISITAKGDNLPTKDNKREDSIVKFYLAQVVLSPAEVGREFSRVYWREKRAKQDAFLFGGGASRGNDVRVSDPIRELDRLTHDQLA